MKTYKKIENNELYVYQNGVLIYKKWLKTGYSKVFDLMAYDKYTLESYNDTTYKTSNSLIIVKAELELKPTEHGGRKTGFVSGFRPNHVFERKQEEVLQTFIGDITFNDWHTIEPGEKKNVTVRFIDSPKLHRHLQLGKAWDIYEGQKLIGQAKILSLYDTNEV
ncbi:hypothetical protein G7074_10365 [Pedobacter sp. HDW13]|uniref:hypothetical protein n=1 Tax=unclassified Pedobacter TaxID=2628915 RepID=UPI000F5A872A|nr:MULTISPECIES: hypothetical protein [unclassified Pedobacter]QIL39642.1 hypothetical protein G7074_10365 [Pedobacter sp. HDW13]RQO78686.1 hypothetical protein DBR40_05870 [Pedobacter sp. KBW01]